MMYEKDYWQAQLNDRQRLTDWVNKEGWKFEQPSGGQSSRKRRRTARQRPR